ncbi:stress responsive protein, partial [Genlisea aurea]
LSGKPTVKLHCRAETHHALSVRDGKVILARADPLDPFQIWIKDEQFSAAVRDEEGLPSFALINKATRQAIQHSIAATQPVQLVPYDPKVLDESILWTESKDTGDGYRAIRMANNIRLNFDAFHGDKKHGGVHDGSIVVLWEWTKGDNQRWKIVP